MLLAFVLLGRAMEARAKVGIVLLSLFGVTAFEESILCLLDDSSVCFCSPLPLSSNYTPPLPPMGGPGWGGGGGMLLLASVLLGRAMEARAKVGTLGFCSLLTSCLLVVSCSG
jgi:hypothetical protein